MRTKIASRLNPRRLLSILFILLLPFLFSGFSLAAEDEGVVVHLFWARGCSYCAKEKLFLEVLKEQYPQVEVRSYELTESGDNRELMGRVGKRLGVDVSDFRVPFTVVGANYIFGYGGVEDTGRQIEALVLEAMEGGCVDIVTGVGGGGVCDDPDSEPSDLINLPFLGEVRASTVSLPLLTFLVALVDGFNPCAMWALLFLISILLGMKDRRRMWLLGTAFVATSAFVYFLFLVAWLNLFLLLGYVFWVRVLVGLVALGAGAYYVRDYFVNKGGGCEVVKEGRRERVFGAIREVIRKRSLLLALLGIIALAVAVNLVELVCSVGLPAVYTRVLSLSQLPPWQYYLYLLFYILIFMLDDLAVFFLAMTTLKMVGIQTRYTRYCRLAGGALIVIIGLILLFKPEVLMFG
jgi:hypothetical protein